MALALQMLALRSLLLTSDLEAALADAELAYAGLPPGLWHASACFASGVLHFVLGDDEAAAVVLAEGATEARLVGAVTIEAQCLGNLALVCAAQGDWARARPHARAARRLLRDHDLEHRHLLQPGTARFEPGRDGFPGRRAAITRQLFARLA
jgi:ATP/maltotriose-dependent transcriptional regulator MalT